MKKKKNLEGKDVIESDVKVLLPQKGDGESQCSLPGLAYVLNSFFFFSLYILSSWQEFCVCF